MRRALRDAGKAALGTLHDIGLRAGLTILPNHYYTPVADRHRLALTSSSWARRAELRGIDTAAGPQVDWLAANVAPFEAEYRGNAVYKTGMTQGFGPGYGYIEAQCYHGVLRALKPRRVVEIGSGVSTWCALQALEINAAEGRPGRVTCIEPYPSDFLRAAAIDLVAQPVEQLAPSYFDTLEAGDVLFIDSTHAVRPGGDVLYIYLSLLPRLKPGVIVHIHDIYLPFLYQRDVLTTLFQWTETALLAALLTNNDKLRILVCLSQLSYDAPEALARTFPDYIRSRRSTGCRRVASDISRRRSISSRHDQHRLHRARRHGLSHGGAPRARRACPLPCSIAPRPRQRRGLWNTTARAPRPRPSPRQTPTSCSPASATTTTCAR